MERRGVSLLIILILGLSIMTLSKVAEEPQYQAMIPPVKLHAISYITHEPFNITSDTDFEIQAWPGNGSFSNPYVIENLNITTSNSTCIWVMNTTSHFVIQNCLFESPIWEFANYYQVFPLTLTNVSNGEIRGNQIVNSIGGISAYALSNCSISSNRFNVTWTGIEIVLSNFTELVNNTQQLGDYYYGIGVSRSRNCTVSINEFRNVRSHGIRGWSNYNTTFVENTIIASDSELDLPWIGIDIVGGESCIVRRNEIANFDMSGIEVHGKDHLVENNNITSNQRGILISTNSSNVRGNNLTDNFSSIELVKANDTKVYDNTIWGKHGRYDAGVVIHGGYNCHIYSNLISHVGYGLILQGATGFNISYNIVNDGPYGFAFGWSGYGYLLVGDGPSFDCDILNNSFDGGGFWPHVENYEQWDFGTIRFEGNTVNNRPIGFYAHLNGVTLDGDDYGQLILISCTDVVVSEGDFRGILSDWVEGEYSDPGVASAIFLLNCTGCDLIGTRFHNNTIGVSIRYSTGCFLQSTSGDKNSVAAISVISSGGILISDGYFVNNSRAISFSSSWSSRIFNCLIWDNEEAIILSICPNFTITHNVIFQNIDAVYLGDSDRCNISQNDIYLNSRGLLLNSSSTCLITQNNVSNNAGVGICLDITAHRNEIYGNTFLNNTPNAICEGSSNHWDDQIDTGNRWSDYSGEGPYIIDDDDQDNFPIVDPTITPPTSVGHGLPVNILFIGAAVILGTVALVIVIIDRRKVIIID